MNDRITILVVEDNRVLRDGLIALLDGQPDMKVVSAIGSGNNVPETISQVRPDIELLDLSLWSDKRRSALERQKKAFPEVKVIGMGLLPMQANIIEAVEVGVSGFILKDAMVSEFLKTIRSVAKGIRVLPPILVGSLFSRVIESALIQRERQLASAARMTTREHEIVVLIADGLSNKTIGARLNIATHTVKSHVHNIMEKLALHTRLQIAKYAHEENP